MDASSSTAIPGTSARPDPGLPAAGTPPTSGRARLGRLSGLDGLRAVAVAAVLLYHADLGLLPGGFLGVDLFFVISGFLITVLLLVEWQATGRLDLPAFWLRRARRLLPALYALLLGVLAFAVLVLPGEVARLRGDAAAALGYITNWYLVVGQQSYFDAIGRPSPLRHLWSLAVEEQFYVGWPILLAGLLALRRPRLAFAATVGLAALSGAWMAVLFVPDADPSRAYYGTDTRLAGLLIGAALAFLWSCRREDGGQEGDGRPPWDRRSAALDGLGLVALAVVVAAFALADDAAPLLYRGGFSAFAVAGAVLIATVTRPASRLGRLLGVRPLRWLGERSYAIYLWHWPVFVLTRPGLDVPLDPLADLVPRLALTLVLADVSYRLVERPIRGGALGRAWTGWRAQRRRAVRAGSAAVLLAGSAAVAVLAARVVVAVPQAPPAYLSVAAVEGTAAPGAIVPLAARGEGGAVPTKGGQVGAGAAGGVAGTPAASGRPPAGSDATSPAATAAPGAAGPDDSAAPAAPGEVGLPPDARPAPPVLAIGDSVMVGAAPALYAAVPGLTIDAVIGRSFGDGVDRLAALAAAGRLPSTVVVHLGDNGRVFPADLDALMAAAGDRRVVLVDVRVPRDWEDRDNGTFRDAVRRFPNVVLVDWFAATQGRPDLFWPDGLHVRPAGAQLYAALVAAALP